jgi:hypothetical protein
MRDRCRIQFSFVAVIIAACSQQSPQPSLSVPFDTASSTRTSEIGTRILELELLAAARLYGDSTGQTEGAEEMRHTLISSSVLVLQAAVQRDSADMDAWLALGTALSNRAYRGEGAWDLPDQRAAVQAIGRARDLARANPPVLARVDSILADERETLRRLERP